MTGALLPLCSQQRSLVRARSNRRVPRSNSSTSRASGLRHMVRNSRHRLADASAGSHGIELVEIEVHNGYLVARKVCARLSPMVAHKSEDNRRSSCSSRYAARRGATPGAYFSGEITFEVDLKQGGAGRIQVLQTRRSLPSLKSVADRREGLPASRMESWAHRATVRLQCFHLRVERRAAAVLTRACHGAIG